MKKSKKQYSICIATYFDKNFKEVGDLSLKGMRKYAKKYRFDLVVDNQIKSRRPPAWNKILLVQKLLSSKKNYDFVLWIDPDTLFFRLDKDIREEIQEGKDFYLVKSNSTGQELPLTGVFLIRNSDWSKEFLKNVWALKKYTYHNWWENAAVDELIGYKDVINYNPLKLFVTGILSKLKCKKLATNLANKIKTTFNLLKNKNTLLQKKQIIKNKKFFSHKDHEKVKWLGLEWDSLINAEEARNPIIMHYPAMSIKERFKKMSSDLMKLREVYSR